MHDVGRRIKVDHGQVCGAAVTFRVYGTCTTGSGKGARTEREGGGAVPVLLKVSRPGLGVVGGFSIVVMPSFVLFGVQ